MFVAEQCDGLFRLGKSPPAILAASGMLATWPSGPRGRCTEVLRQRCSENFPNVYYAHMQGTRIAFGPLVLDSDNGTLLKEQTPIIRPGALPGVGC
ncbi:MAG: hypothetical protein EOS37_19195 [Mesorhizobium sp.]|nr:MAG: hypothetical protein EOS37_19195 [Mesorhizobium sp.]